MSVHLRADASTAGNVHGDIGAVRAIGEELRKASKDSKNLEVGGSFGEKMVPFTITLVEMLIEGL